MSRLLGVGVAIVVVALAAACAAIPTDLGERERESTPAKPKPPERTRALVTVVDGDTHERLDGARVVIGRRADYANTRGLASVRLKRRVSLQVRVSKPGYIPTTVRMPFGERRQLTVKLYNRALQWTMFGANARRTSAHT